MTKHPERHPRVNAELLQLFGSHEPEIVGELKAVLPAPLAQPLPQSRRRPTA